MAAQLQGCRCLVTHAYHSVLHTVGTMELKRGTTCNESEKAKENATIVTVNSNFTKIGTKRLRKAED